MSLFHALGLPPGLPPHVSNEAKRGMSLPNSGQRQGTRSPSTKKHRCPYCATEFTRHHNLKSHLLTHSQEKPYVCSTCQSRFRRLHDLKRHTKLHTGERPQFAPSAAGSSLVAMHWQGTTKDQEDVREGEQAWADSIATKSSKVMTRWKAWYMANPRIWRIKKEMKGDLAFEGTMLPRVPVARPTTTHASQAPTLPSRVDLPEGSQVAAFHHEPFPAQLPQARWHQGFLRPTLTQVQHHPYTHLGRAMRSLDRIRSRKALNRCRPALPTSDNCLSQDQLSIVTDLPACSPAIRNLNSAKARVAEHHPLGHSVCHPPALSYHLHMACSHPKRVTLYPVREDRLILQRNQVAHQRICVAVDLFPHRATAYQAMASPTKVVVRLQASTRTSVFGRMCKAWRLA